MRLDQIPLLKRFMVPERLNGASRNKPGESEQQLLELGSLDPEAALAKLGVTGRGLEPAQVEERLGRFGANEAVHERRLGFVAELWERIKNPLVLQLLVIAIVSYAMGDLRAATVVGGMIVLSVFLAYFQEMRSSKAAEKLQAMIKTTCTALRGGKEVDLPMRELVPGDIVVLAAGSIIPADLRLIVSKDFYVGQSALTGEAMPVEKHSKGCDTAGKAALDVPNAAFQGSTVLSGTARAVVVNTGAKTYFGGISEKLGRQRVLTSFDKGINSFTWLMIRFMVVMVAAVFLIIGFTKHDSAHPWVDALLFGLAVAVGLTPEMLPMIVTVNLSKGAIAMARKKAIVKRLNSIQNFGAMDVLCTDKTGTLTQDRIVLERHVDVTNRESDDVLRYAYLNSFYQTGLRSLLDKTILAHDDLDVGRACGKVDEIPFDFQRRRMSVVIDYEGDHVLVCKGAVEEVVRASSQYQVDDEVHPLIDMLRNDILEEYESLSAQGYRVLAVAYREFPTTQRVFSIADESNLTLLGYIAFFDPPKDSSAKALEALTRSGVVTKILTGDNDLVTRKVCQDVGLKIEGLVTGDKLNGLSDDEFSKLVEKTNVFARLSPAQKEQIIHALQRAGHVVGFMGDGINDAPAMKAADVGISVDTAVDVAKESADIILLEKNLMVLEDGILEGRRVFGNIIKYIKMGASSNFGNMFSMVGGSFFLPFLPMAPIQVLVNNLLYDFSQVGIPTDRVDEEYLEKPRRWNIASIKRFMIFLGPVSSIFDYTTFFLMLLVFNCWNYSKLPSDAALLATQGLQLTGAGTPFGFPIGIVGAALKSYYENLFHTGWFVESILTQTLIVHVIRTNRIPFLQSRASWALSLTTLLVMGAAIALPYSPLAGYLSLEPLPLSFWGYIAATLVAYVGLAHVMKTWFIKKYGAD